MKIKIITDSASDIPYTFAKEYDITILPLSISFGLDTFLDGIDITTKEFYKKLTSSSILPKTSQINEFCFTEKLMPYKDTDTIIVLILLASEMSNTYNSAKKAVDNLKMENQIILLDTRQVTFSEGYIVMETAKFIKEKSPSKEELIEKIKFFIDKVRIYAMIGNLTYLQKGGRLSATSAKLGSLLHIKPIISIKDKVDVVSKQIGIAKSFRFIIETLKNRNTDYPVCFGHSATKEDIAVFIKKVNSEIMLTGKEFICELGATVGTHAGPGCIGLCFIEK